MTLSPQVLYVQECVLKAVHHTDDIEEAIEKSLDEDVYFCKKTKTYIYSCWQYTIKNLSLADALTKLTTIPSLDRVLYALWNRYIYYDWGICEVDETCHSDSNCSCWKRHYGISIWKILRKLLNNDWTSCNLFDQSEKTINAIANILWYKHN